MLMPTRTRSPLPVCALPLALAASPAGNARPRQHRPVARRRPRLQHHQLRRLRHRRQRPAPDLCPDRSQLSSVALCVSAAVRTRRSSSPSTTAGGDADRRRLDGLNPSIPDAAGPPVRYVHVDFVQPYTVTPGATYIIENVSGVPITWYGTTAGSPYTYCLGAPNTSAVGDYGFQSFLADAPGASAACPEPPNSHARPPTNTPLPSRRTPRTRRNQPSHEHARPRRNRRLPQQRPPAGSAVPPPTSNALRPRRRRHRQRHPAAHDRQCSQAPSSEQRHGTRREAMRSRRTSLLLLVLGAGLLFVAGSSNRQRPARSRRR